MGHSRKRPAMAVSEGEENSSEDRKVKLNMRSMKILSQVIKLTQKVNVMRGRMSQAVRVTLKVNMKRLKACGQVAKKELTQAMIKRKINVKAKEEENESAQFLTVERWWFTSQGI